MGGLDLAVGLAVPGSRSVLYVEAEASAAAILAARMADGSLAPAAVWSDLGTFDGRPWRGVVDCLIAGLPCQPYSTAGKQRGHDDERAIWPEFMRVVGEVRPALVFLENVPAFLRFFQPVGERLSELGYRYQAGIFSAAEVGASHLRERFFCLAYAGQRIWGPEAGRGPCGQGPDWSGERREPLANAASRGQRERGEPSRGDRQPDGSYAAMESYHVNRGEFMWEVAVRLGLMADPGQGGLGARERLLRPQGGQPDADGTGSHVGHAASDDEQWDRWPAGRCQSSTRGPGCDVEHTTSPRRQGCVSGAHEGRLGSFPPGPEDRDAWAAILAERPDLAPAVEPALRGVVARPSGIMGLARFPRSIQLALLGNSVVPACAAHAFRTLARELGIG